MKKLTPRPQSRPLRKLAIPLVAGVLLVSTSACYTDVVGVEEGPESEPETDGGTEPDAQPEAVGVVEGPIDAGVSFEPEDVDGGEPGVDG